MITSHMKEKQIGDVDCLIGTLENERYNLFVMKEPDYDMKLMATYGSLTYHENEKKNSRFCNGETHTFKYTKPFSDHFKYRHLIDDHNNLRHSSPSFEDTWTTHRWPNRVFAFLLAVTEVNLYLYLRYSVWREDERPTLHQFRKKLAFALIFNKWIVSDEVEAKILRSSSSRRHVISTAPPRAKKF